jgi:hypothetical protein
MNRTKQLAQFRRLRWVVRIVLTLGVAASVAANILHADPHPISQTIAAWPPLALLLTVELVSRIPMHRRSLAAVRIFATAAIAGIAAWISYWHMAGTAARYGEGDSAYLLPFTVDGLIVVASVSLVELAGRIRVLEEAPAEPVAAPTAPVVQEVREEAAVVLPAPVSPGPAGPVGRSVKRRPASPGPQPRRALVSPLNTDAAGQPVVLNDRAPRT